MNALYQAGLWVLVCATVVSLLDMARLSIKQEQAARRLRSEPGA